MHSWCTGSGSRHQHQMHWDSSGFATDRRHRVRQKAWTQKEGTDSKKYTELSMYTEVVQIHVLFSRYWRGIYRTCLLTQYSGVQWFLKTQLVSDSVCTYYLCFRYFQKFSAIFFLQKSVKPLKWVKMWISKMKIPKK